MKKTVFFLILLIFSRIGVSYAAGTNPIGIGDFFTGNNIANLSNANINQVLGLLVGPSGTPGPAGVAGKDGLNGLNGINGMPGAPGATGATGATGPAGPAGKDGTLTGSAAFAGGAAVVSVCGNQQTDPGLTLSINPQFDGSGFNIASISVGNISKDCSARILRLYFTINNENTTSSIYNWKTVITCSHDLTAGELLAPLNNLNLNADNLSCTAVPAAHGALAITSIRITDLDSISADKKVQTSTNIGITIS